MHGPHVGPHCWLYVVAPHRRRCRFHRRRNFQFFLRLRELEVARAVVVVGIIERKRCSGDRGRCVRPQPGTFESKGQVSLVVYLLIEDFYCLP